MSRTFKLHRHKTRCDKRYELQHKSRRTHYRTQIKNLLKKSADYEEVSFPAEKSIVSKKTSSGYLDPLETEDSLTRMILGMKNAVLNGYPAKLWGVPGLLDKELIYAATQKDPAFKGFTEAKETEQYLYCQRAIEILSEEELKECIHKYYARKGGKKYHFIK